MRTPAKPGKTPKRASKEFLRSSAAIREEDGALHSLEAVGAWLEREAASMHMRVRRIPFRHMGAWRFSSDRPLRLVHETGRFFAVEGFRFRVPGSGKSWDQPILNQPDVGLLGFLVTPINGVLHWLAQVKWEPGSREPQLSPTVQATHSNYTRAHGGRAQPYFEHFQSPPAESVLFDADMPEHGFHFLAKWNRNVVVAVEPDLPVREGFCWVTLGQLRSLIRRDGVVHMDTRSVLGCLPVGADGEGDRLSRAARSAHEEAVIRSACVTFGEETAAWLDEWEKTERITREPRALDELQGWSLDDDALRPITACPRMFSIIGVEVEANRREVSCWTQPLVAPENSAFLGLLCRRTDGILECLVQRRVEPGYESWSQLFPTVASDEPSTSPLIEHFTSAPAHALLLSTRNSDEGGRFFLHDARYQIVQAAPDVALDVPPTHRWCTLGELAEMGRLGRVSIELRNLLAGFPVVSPDATLFP